MDTKRETTDIGDLPKSESWEEGEDKKKKKLLA